MLKKSHRLLTRRVNEVVTTGKVAHSPMFTLRYADSVLLRAAAVAPVKIAKTAVLRNRTRRSIYLALRAVLAEVSGRYDLVLIAKSPALEADNKALAKDIKDLFVKAKIIR